MRKSLLCTLVAFLATMPFVAHAIDAPTVPATPLVDGESYVLMNYYTPKKFLQKTSWDTSLYFTVDMEQWKNCEFTAKKLADGNYSFSQGDSAYFGVDENVGGGNVRFYKADAPIEWTVLDGDFTNYYKLKASTGNTDVCVDSLVHLNNGGEYVVISVIDHSWYPDYCSDATNYNWCFCKKADVELYIGKLSFYAAIDKAKTTLGESDDATLKAAISEAEASYTSATTMDEINEAQTKLANAVSDFNIRTKGDMTNLLSNPSFEDLSSQDGNTTSGVAAAPTGWNIYINGVKCTTAAEIQAGGVANWCGINGDCDAATRDGNYAFGIWTSSVPEFEISQTVSGLKNGTYLVSGKIMGSSNSNGSRLTTQRVFAGTNSCYFGHESDYSVANLAAGENYTFAGHDETSGDASALQACSVQAYVYDGTLTLGLRTNGILATGVQANGGQGWFKTDNFTLAYKGFDINDALSALTAFINQGTSLVDSTMEQKVMDQLESDLTTAKALNASSSADNVNSAIISLKSDVAAGKTSSAAYSNFNKALQEAIDNINKYGDYNGAGEYSDAYTEWQELYDSKSVSASEIDSIIPVMEKAAETLKLSGVVENQDITSLIVNPSFEDLSAQNGNVTSGVAAPPKGWEITVNGTKCTTAAEISAAGIQAWCGVNGDVDDTRDGTYGFGIWAASVPEFQLSQTIKGLKGGYYTVTCQLMGSSNGSGSRMTTQRLFVNNFSQYFGSETDYNTAVLDSLYPNEKGHYTFAGYTETASDQGPLMLMSVQAGIGTGDDLTFGIRTSGNLRAVLDRAKNAANGDGWFKVDNFTLTCNKIDEAAAVNFTTSGTACAKSISIYGVDGTRKSALRHGINIVKTTMSDGTTAVSKVVVR